MSINKQIEHLSIQVHMPFIAQSPQYLRTNTKACECMNVQLHDPLILQAYRHIIIQVCAHVDIK